MQQTTNPTIKWAQRKDKLFITIDVVGVISPVIDIVDGRTLKFSGATKDHKYSFEIEFYEEVLKEESKYTFDSRNIFLNIKKKVKGPYWPRLTKNAVKVNWIQNDWTYYIDEDEEEEEGASKMPNFGGNEHSNLFL
jgi:prostaglandin-E synthase